MSQLVILLVTITTAPRVNILRHISPDSSRPTGFQEWQETRAPLSPWRAEKLRTTGISFNPMVGIIVESTLVLSIIDHLDTLINDLTAEGYQVTLFSAQGGSCESLRTLLQQEYQNGLTSAILIGNLPVAWFQMIDDWNNNRRRDPDEGYEEFPCDLYFMDLDGIWEDNWHRYDTLDSLVPGTDSIFDTHSGDIAPEIGVSRIYVNPLGNQVALVRSYLSRCHQYRSGRLNVTDRALVYIDDDWVPWAGEWNNLVGFLYPERVFIADSEQTRVRDYQPRIDTAAYQWMQLCAHSWPGGHAMKYNRGRSWDWFYAESIPRFNPEVSFYNLFACSNARFTEPGYCGGRYVFQSASGLGAVGSTKTGSMLEFGDFYSPLGNGSTLADALCLWFCARAEGGFEPWEKSWFYGMCLIGDGLLKPRVPVAVSENNRSTPPPPIATIQRNQLLLTAESGILLDASGRMVSKLQPGANQLSHLPAGVYFVQTSTPPRTFAITIIR